MNKYDLVETTWVTETISPRHAKNKSGPRVPDV